MSNLADKINQKINDQKIAPRSRWLFVLKNLCVWAAIIFSLFLAALVLSIVAAIASGFDPRLPNLLGFSRPLFWLLFLPHSWLLLALGLAVGAYWALRHTSRGYRYTASALIFAVVLILAASSGGLFYSRAGELADFRLRQNFPLYQNWRMNHHARLWDRPNRGLLTGTVTDIATTTVTIQTPSGRLFSIPKDKLSPDLDIQIGDTLDLLGDPVFATSTFTPTGASGPPPFLPRETHRFMMNSR